MGIEIREHCATPVRHMQVGIREAQWNSDEWKHLASCQRCRDIQLDIFRSTGNQARGLIADDSIEARAFIEVALKKLNVNLTMAEDGGIALQQAVDALREEKPFDFFVLDLRMPTLDGCDVAQRLRMSGYETRPVMILTEWADREGLREQCEQHRLTLLSKHEMNRVRLASHVEMALAGIPPSGFVLPA
jgi:CheY-like chemotaxis protein